MGVAVTLLFIVLGVLTIGVLMRDDEKCRVCGERIWREDGEWVHDLPDADHEGEPRSDSEWDTTKEKNGEA